MALYAAFAEDWYQRSLLFSIGLLISGASLVTGGFAGFLFGIPKTTEIVPDTRGSDILLNGRPNAIASYKGNTNLEQISDWLTKILVGVGLTQLTSIPSKLQQLCTFLATGMSNSSGDRILILGLILFFGTSGFLVTFLWTRLYMATALRYADDLSAGLEAFQNKVKSQEEQDARALSVVNRHLNPSQDSPPILEEDLINAIKEASPSVRVQLFYLADQVRTMNWRSDKRKMERTIPIFRGLIASDPQDSYHRNHGQLGFALKDMTSPDWKQAEFELSKAIAIRDNQGELGWEYYEFVRAMCKINVDQHFKQSKPSSEQDQEAIRRDLCVVWNSENKEILKRSKDIQDWLSMNQIDLSLQCRVLNQ